jgi:hypothetical protein
MEGVRKMKKMTSVALRSLCMGLPMMALTAAPGVTQVVTGRVALGQVVECPRGLEQGSLGITGLDCVGECTLTIVGEGKERSWFFSTEPKILGVERDGPALGILEAGDFLVAIEGIPITTREGGRLYANLQPGEEVNVRFRRGRTGRTGEAEILVAADCLEAPEPVVGVVARVAPPVEPVPDRPPRTRAVPVVPNVAIGVAPQIRVTSGVRVVEGNTVVVGSVPLAGFAARAPNVSGLFGDVTPTGHLGIGFSCRDCGTRTDEETGEEIWFFRGSLEVTAVNRDGPADDVGIVRGDLIRAIEGHAIESDEGGRAFTGITPGEEVRLTVVRRNGRELEVVVLPEEKTLNAVRVSGVAAPLPPNTDAVIRVVAVPDPPSGVSSGRVNVIPLRETAISYDEPLTGVAAPPPDMPLRWTGTLEGVEVEVRGEPVRVSEMRGIRTLVINADGLWIRIRIPRGEGEPVVEPLIRR